MNKNSTIHLIHNDWKGECVFDKKNIYRKDCPDEYGTFSIDKNMLTINWCKWGIDIFLCGEDFKKYYSEKIYNKFYDIFYIFDTKDILTVVINKESSNFVIYSKRIITGKYKIDNENELLLLDFNNNTNIYKKIYNKIYCPNYNNLFFTLELMNSIDLHEVYLFNSSNKLFYNTNNINISGKYETIDNSIILTFTNGDKKTFESKRYISKMNENDNNDHKNSVKLIKPNNVLINDRVLFSNISLCKNKIICTSIYYRDNPWLIDDIIIYTKDCNIVNKTIYEHDDYESSFSIILELNNIPENVSLYIGYKNSHYHKFNLKQMNICSNKISAVTLFKDDYPLLKRYLKHYVFLGIEVFFLYYNGIVNNELIKNISEMNNLDINTKIYIIQWDYQYWWYYLDLKHHHAQTMAINDSLNIMKIYCQYVLYNDLDEYIVFDKNNISNFNDLICNNKDIDCFIFKNRFCKMGKSLISYENFDKEFNLNNIIEGNYWDKGREKNLIKLKNINVMGVHQYYDKFNDVETYRMDVCQFYHILNFSEKYREELMTQYIS